MKTLLALSLFSLFSCSHAASLNGRTKDDSVCDLSPYTTSRLSQLTFVDGNSSNQSEIYGRLALRWITTSCHDSQQLILHTDLGLRMEDVYFRDVATRLCGANNVIREAQPNVDAPHSFQVKCTIAKLQDAKSWLQNAEREKSTESLIAASKPIEDSPQSQQEDAERKPRSCRKGLTLGALLGISGGCRD